MRSDVIVIASVGSHDVAQMQPDDKMIHTLAQLKEIALASLGYVPGATHAPHHPTPEWIKKISDMHLFDEGWKPICYLLAQHRGANGRKLSRYRVP